jgi:hypothetical protein
VRSDESVPIKAPLRERGGFYALETGVHRD